MEKCIFTNDNNICINLLNHSFSNNFKNRDNHEIIFRKINTFLIKSNIIKNNIIDLGAWIGDNSIPWAKNTTNIVYAIDPSPENINFINEMCELNNIKNIITIQKAISNINEILSTYDNLHHCSFIYENPELKLNEINKVDAVSLDYLHNNNIINNIGYIHLDVEGMEYKILEGSEKIIDLYNPIITFEQHLEIDDYNIILIYLKKKNIQFF
jgi:FkbM family methyltransferase